jgi:hypothetical protein
MAHPIGRSTAIIDVDDWDGDFRTDSVELNFGPSLIETHASIVNFGMSDSGFGSIFIDRFRQGLSTVTVIPDDDGRLFSLWAENCTSVTYFVQALSTFVRGVITIDYYD